MYLSNALSEPQVAAVRPAVRAALASLVLAAGMWPADAAHAKAIELVDLTLEQLRDVVVSSVSRREEPLAHAAAAVYVISSQDIRRSGATTLAEALRLAPTLDVAQADASQYAISARGFSNVLANKMLVMIDGRTVYTPLFSGVFWEAQDVMLDDVERIEVITGPSTALWGTNAVNGLIHVITKRAADTQGSAVMAHAGTAGHGTAVRHGGRLGDDGHYRVFLKAYDRRHSERADGQDIRDAADGLQAGFRADWASATDRFTLEGDLYRASIEQEPGERDIDGVHLLGRWRRQIDVDSYALVQAYLDRTHREQPTLFLGAEGRFEETLHTADVVVQYGLRLGQRHEVLVGAGYRHAKDEIDNPPGFAFLPPDRSLQWSRLFAQDQLSLSPRLQLTVAASAERNPYTGTEFLPSLRLAWRGGGGGLWWGSLSRAVRAPSRIDREFYAPAEPPYVLAGGEGFQSELSDVIELGYRGRPRDGLTYALTLFHHEHRRLRSLEPTPDGLVLENDIEGSTRGVQGWLRWQVLPQWLLQGGGVALDQRLRVRDGAVDSGGLRALGNDPSHWWSLRSSLDIGSALAWDVAVRRVGVRPDPRVPAYTAVDTRLAWRVRPELEIALIVRNVFDPGHVEWGGSGNGAEFGRSASLQLRWQL